MDFCIVDNIPHPRPLVFATHRDKVVEMVPYLPNVKSVVIEKNDVDGPVTNQLYRWIGESHDVPRLLRPLIKTEFLSWLDKSIWYQDEWRCEWELELSVLPNAISARGYNIFLEDGDDTIVQMNGQFTIHPERITGVPTFVARRIAPAVEKFIVSLLEPNMRESNKAVFQYIQDQD
jgi:hypothetical protein